uniref:Peptidase C2 calpain domain-containing protein n=1 Tax=Paramoeba aestuarina TaxID=180227 RepID=A0A7S4USS0_9EUKA|mmetsp:Transcript_38122/g.60324  ORF Transcript_38122/g.60324 Transcript_38122/m.60324 type:complete len:360 (+) Transcript_38122:422-1501(+)
MADPNVTYVLIPSTHKRGLSLPYDLTIYVQKGWEIVSELTKEPQISKIESEWKGLTAGGCPNHCTWIHNPQFSVIPSYNSEVSGHLKGKSGTLAIALKQLGSEPPNPVGMFVFGKKGGGSKIGDSGRPSGSHYYRRMKLEGIKSQFDSFINRQSITVDTKINAGEEIFPLVVVPCTFERAVERKFAVEVVFTEDGADNKQQQQEEQQFVIKPVKEFPGYLILDGKWENPDTTGGSRNNAESWLSNPLFVVSLTRVGTNSKKVHVRAALGCVAGARLQPYGMEMFEKDEKGKRGYIGRSFGVSKYGANPSLEVVEEWAGEGGDKLEVVVVPSTYKKGVEGEFVLSLFSLTHTIGFVKRVA